MNTDDVLLIFRLAVEPRLVVVRAKLTDLEVTRLANALREAQESNWHLEEWDILTIPERSGSLQTVLNRLPRDLAFDIGGYFADRS